MSAGHRDTPPVSTRAQLLAWRCRPLGAHDACSPGQTAAQLAELPGWRAEGVSIEREYRFPDYRSTIGFVDAVAAIAEAQDHHPELAVAYGRCLVRWSTHSANAVTMNDFACAALTDAAFEPYAR